MKRRTDTGYPAGFNQGQPQGTVPPVYYYQNPVPGMQAVGTPQVSVVYPDEAEERAREYWQLSRSRLRMIRALGLLAVAAVVMTALFAFGVIRTGVAAARPAVTEFELKDIGELATEAASLSIIQPVESSRTIGGIELPGSRNTYNLTYVLVLKAGLDFDRIVLQVDGKAHTITLKMPEVRILSAEAYLSAWEGGDNVLSQLTPEEIEGARNKVIEKAGQTAVERGTLEKARENAEKLISGLLAGGYDLTEYTIRYQWP